MKEFALKHPWMTFFLLDAAIVNICKVVCILTGHGKEVAETTTTATATETNEESES